MWTEKPVDAVRGAEIPARNCVATSILADELEGLPQECRKAPIGCAEHSRRDGDDSSIFGLRRGAVPRPQRPDGEQYICNECMRRCESWLDSVIPWVRAKRAKAPTVRSSPGASDTPIPSVPVLGKDLLGWIFKHVILIWEQKFSRAYYKCVNATSFDIRIARLQKGLHEIELRPEHLLPKQARAPHSPEEVLNATVTLLSLSTVCKSWREAAMDEPVWLDVLKDSSVRAFIPRNISTPRAATSTNITEESVSLAHVTTCRELAMRVSRQTVACGILPVRKWAPNYYQVLPYLRYKDDVFEFIKECKTGTIIAESSCVIGGRNKSLEYWQKHSKLLGRS
ncbi:hypothetical protein Pelo_15047 [Pelomyxa schiedti]|nr:hypothetical protein Pelo_15047 [Pelomyxa schiedti]